MRRPVGIENVGVVVVCHWRAEYQGQAVQGEEEFTKHVFFLWKILRGDVRSLVSSTESHYFSVNGLRSLRRVQGQFQLRLWIPREAEGCVGR